MSAMKPPAADQPLAVDGSKIDPLRTRTGADTDEPYIHHYKSVKMPGVAKGQILPDWVHKRFRRKDTSASR